MAPRLKRLLGALVFTAIAIWLHVRAPLMWFYDTKSYRVAAELPFWRRFTAERPPGMPFLLALAGNDELFTWLQLLFYLGGALALAFAAARWMHRERAKHFAFFATLALSLLPQLCCWNRTLGSESLANSLLLIGLALATLVARPPARGRWAAFAGLVLVAAWWTFVRDADGYFLVFLCSAAFSTALILRRRRRESAALLGVALVLCLACSRTADAGKRFKWPFVNVLGIRILPQADRRAFFVEHGMPINDRVLCYSGHFGASCGLDLSGFGTWLDGDIRGIYERYLLSHPLETLIAPYRRLGRLLYLREKWPNGQRGDLMYLFPHIAEWQRLWGVWFLETDWMMAILLVALAFGLRRARDRRRFIAPLAIMISVLPMIFLVWHADEMEVMRHSVVPAALWRIGLLFGCAISLDS